MCLFSHHAEEDDEVAVVFDQEVDFSMAEEVYGPQPLRRGSRNWRMSRIPRIATALLKLVGTSRLYTSLADPALFRTKSCSLPETAEGSLEDIKASDFKPSLVSESRNVLQTDHPTGTVTA